MALTVSVLLHLLGIWLAYVLAPVESELQQFWVRRPKRVIEPQRFTSHPTLPVPRPLLEQLRSEGTPQDVDIGTVSVPGDILVRPDILLAEQSLPQVAGGGKRPWESKKESLRVDLYQLKPTGKPLALVDPVALDAERRRRTVAIIDPETGKLKQAFLHLPAYTNAPTPCEGCPGYHGGRQAREIYNFITWGAALSGRVPIQTEIHWFKLGGCIRWPAPALKGFDKRDPIHTYGCRPRRHILSYAQMKEYSVLLLQYMDVESTETLGRYLIEGGFAMMNRTQLALVRQELQSKVGQRIKAVTLELGHPIFHSYYDFTRYVPGNGICPFGIVPIRGLQLDGRLVAVVGIGFVMDQNCPGNEFYVNVIAYGLIQPSPMGGRYISRRTD